MMENGAKLKTENKIYNETYDDGSFDGQPKTQVKGANLSLFRNDRSSIFSNKVFWNRYSCNSHRHIDGAALSQNVVG